MGSLKRLGHLLLTAAIITGCADLQRLVTPSPPPEPPPLRREPPPVEAPPIEAPPVEAPPVEAPPPEPPPRREPPRVLLPQVDRRDEDRLTQEASGKIHKTEQIVAQIDRTRLAKEQAETYSTIQHFLTNAKEALAARDFPRATNLAEKARILAEELVQAGK